MKLPKQLRFNYDDYCRLPNNGRKHEIIDGDLHNHPAPVTKHQRVAGILFNILYQHVTSNRLGEVFISPVDVIFSYEDIVQPDIMFISREKRKIITTKNVKGTPDLIIEITSPGTEEYDRILKKRLYAKYKVKEYWVVDIVKKQVELFELKKYIYEKHLFKKKDKLNSRIIEGLTVDLTKIF